MPSLRSPHRRPATRPRQVLQVAFSSVVPFVFSLIIGTSEATSPTQDRPLGLTQVLGYGPALQTVTSFRRFDTKASYGPLTISGERIRQLLSTVEPQAMQG